jgi:hypothetical protein
LAYQRQYERSDSLYRELLRANASDEPAAIGLASSLLHQARSTEARDVVVQALTSHPNSLRLLEYKDRIESGKLGGEQREAKVPRYLANADAEYLNDSAGNHSWRAVQGLDFRLRPGLTNRVLFEQQFEHSRDDSFQAIETFSEQLRWKPRESLMLSAGGGAVRFNNHDVHAIYDTSLAFQPRPHLVFGAGFSRVPITPDAEASENRITAQGWDAFASWNPKHWQITLRGSRQHYSDQNLASRQSAEVIRDWGSPRLTFETGYRYRRYSFDEPELQHGYFNPDSYQSHMGMAGIRSQLGKKYRGSFVVCSGMESVSLDSPFRSAWELRARNELRLGKWTFQLDYFKFRLVTESGAFRADAGRFTSLYRF